MHINKFLLIFIPIILVSCHDNSDDYTNAEYQINCKIDGEEYSKLYKDGEDVQQHFLSTYNFNSEKCYLNHTSLIRKDFNSLFIASGFEISFINISTGSDCQDLIDNYAPEFDSHFNLGERGFHNLNIPNRLYTVQLTYEDENEGTWYSQLKTQPSESTFEILSSENIEPDPLTEDATNAKKITGKFNCVLQYEATNSGRSMTITDGIFVLYVDDI
jgi:hypothetical protein